MNKSTEQFLNHHYWVKDGDQLKDGSLYDGKITLKVDAADYAVTARDNTSIEALVSTKKVIVKPLTGVVAIQFRFRGDGTTGDQHVLQMFAAAGDDHYDLVDVLTIDQGTQIYTTGIYFIDTVVSAGEKWHTITKALSSTANNIGGYVMNTHGYNKFLFLASTLDANTSNLYIDWKEL